MNNLCQEARKEFKYLEISKRRDRMKSTWNAYSSLHSSQTVQRLLQRLYEKNKILNAEQKAFENSYAFMYYLMHAENYYKTALVSPLAVQPTLIFYGISQLLKAALLTVDVNYPASSNILAHGVSTRKRKKQQYQFLQDEVKIQKNGLFGYAANCLFHMKHVEGEKFSMFSLLKRIPELHSLFVTHSEKQMLFPLHISDKTICIDKSLSDHYLISTERLKDLLNQKLSLHFIEEKNNKLLYQIPSSVDILWKSKVLVDFNEDKYYLPIKREDLTLFPEILAHYLILYNLSMISRYETEWWYDLLFSHFSDDYIFIKQFVDISCWKTPILFYSYFHFKLL